MVPISKKWFPKLFRPILSAFILLVILSAPLVFAQTSYTPPSVLPATNQAVEGYGDVCIGLADAIRSGDLHLRQIPCFLKYFAQTLIILAGTLSVIFVMVGGYKYMLPTAEDKGTAKKTIIYALVGLAVSLLSWVLVDIILQLLTE